MPPPDDDLEVIWRHEVSRLLYDPYAIEENRWILVWHEYLTFFNEQSGQAERMLEHSWISLKSARSPEGPWSATRRLFTGSIYSDENDEKPPGRPEYPLHQVFPNSNELGNCMVYTEPGLLAREEGIYVSMKCFDGPNSGKVVLLKCQHDFGSCQYLGDLINDSEAHEYGEIYSGFSATELFAKNEFIYLITTPTTSLIFPYRGCLIFRFDNLASASLESSAGVPIVFFSVFGEEQSFNGACGYSPGSTHSGVIYSQLSIDPRIEFRLFASGLNP
ncbi:MAG: hypothetical protein FVQ83_10345 [Chloroflexi bacterium]|nr:hypothetical protein [Chloroflexota bacterium]